MEERRRSVRIDVYNICEIKLTGTADLEFGILKDISVHGFGFLSKEFYNRDDILDTSMVLDEKIISIKGKIVSVHYRNGNYSRYGVEIAEVDESAHNILESYVSEKMSIGFLEKMKKFTKI